LNKSDNDTIVTIYINVVLLTFLVNLPIQKVLNVVNIKSNCWFHERNLYNFPNLSQTGKMC